MLELILTINSILWCGVLVLFVFAIGFSILSWSITMLVTTAVILFALTVIQIGVGFFV